MTNYSNFDVYKVTCPKVNGYVFAATQDSLKNNTISYEKIAEAIEKYREFAAKANEKSDAMLKKYIMCLGLMVLNSK